MSVHEFVAYDGHVKAARSAAQSAKGALDSRLAQVNTIIGAIDAVSDIKNAAGTIEKVAGGIKSGMTLIAKVGLLKFIAEPLGQVLNAVERRMEQVHDTAERLEKKLEPSRVALEAHASQLKALGAALGEVGAQIASVDDGIDDAARALAGTHGHLPAVYDATVGDAAGTIRAAVAAGAAVTQQVGRVTGALPASLPFAGMDGLAAGLKDISGKLGAIAGVLEPIRGPVQEVEKALASIDGVLDMADAVLDLLFGWLIRGILEITGLQRLIDDLAKAAADSLPNFAIADPFESKIAEIEAALAAPLAGLDAAVHAFKDDTVGRLLFGALKGDPTEGGEFAVGDDDNPDRNPGATVAALGGNDVVAGGLGNDTLDGGAGDDILIGGAGDDRIDDGGGTDVAVFLGNFREFAISVPQPGDEGADDPTRLVVAHVGALPGRVRQGTDTVVNVEHFAFLDAAFELSALRDIQRSGSTPSNPATLAGGEGADILVGGEGGDTIGGGGGNDYIIAGRGEDTLTGGPGADTFAGALHRDRITDFSMEDKIVVESLALLRSAVTFADGALSIDSDGDGVPNGTIFLDGDFTGGDFMVARAGADTVVTFHPFLPKLEEKTAVDPGAVNGIVNQAFLTGDGAGTFRMTLDATATADHDNAVGVYEVDLAGRIVDVRILVESARDAGAAGADIAGVEAGHRLGFFIVQDGAAFARGLGEGDALSFVGAAGLPATVFSGAARLAVNGTATTQTVFHSFAAGLNVDGVQHALSGVEPGGAAMTIGFEDMTGGGDSDYQDVVFTVALVAPPPAPDPGGGRSPSLPDPFPGLPDFLFPIVTPFLPVISQSSDLDV